MLIRTMMFRASVLGSLLAVVVLSTGCAVAKRPVRSTREAGSWLFRGPSWVLDGIGQWIRPEPLPADPLPIARRRAMVEAIERGESTRVTIDGITYIVVDGAAYPIMTSRSVPAVGGDG